MTTIALAGNPNSGKTTLFNALTGTYQKVGNWPGVTVEKKSGYFLDSDNTRIEVVDLPGTYGLSHSGGGIDEHIARDYLSTGEVDLIVNVVDAMTINRGLYLTNELLRSDIAIVLVINMMDVATAQGIEIDFDALSAKLDCAVIPITASKRKGIEDVRNAIATASPGQALLLEGSEVDVFDAIDKATQTIVTATRTQPTSTERIDDVILNPWLAFPIFLAVMYLMFLFSINVGSAFIDFFDLLGSALFIEIPRMGLQAIGTPDWLTIFIADGVGGGVQLVSTFIPVIGTLFLALSIIEDSGYMARVAFIVDRLLRSIGLPGKAFVPLIVGFGCNVPSVMATRALETQPDRILTTLMAPYMSCGARLTVYALFAAAFFPTNGQNVVFALYLFGIAVAIFSAYAVRKHLLPATTSHFILELPPYHLPILRNILIQTWQRLKGFVLRAGKAIVIVVIILNVANSIGTDGSVGNENTEKSVLSEIGKSITPLFSPMGIEEDNWPATVGIFTGIFAKEVVVGTLDALYASTDAGSTSIAELIEGAFASVPANLLDLTNQLTDPLGLNLGDLDDLEAQAKGQQVEISTMIAMQTLFTGAVGAFAYLVFLLLYMPCVATIGVIYKEVGSYWAVFSVVWSFMIAYACAVTIYQLSLITTSPMTSTLWIVSVITATYLMFRLLVIWGRRREPNLIKIKNI
ncbi:MAG: ferrous iron transport protein B [Pseudomonadales bacterium]|nr:ferrous iron transport protein B [Pseudomonadales bacterium]